MKNMNKPPNRLGDKIRSEMFKNKNSIAMSLESKENRDAEILRMYRCCN